MRWISLVAVLALASPAAADPLEGIEIAPEVDAEYDRDSMYGDWAEEDCHVRNRGYSGPTLGAPGRSGCSQDRILLHY